VSAADRIFALLGASLLALAFVVPGPAARQPTPAPLAVEPLRPPETLRSAVLGPGETLVQLLAGFGLDAASAHRWAEATRGLLDVRALPVGLTAEAVFDHHGTLRTVRLTPDWRATFVLRSGGDAVDACREPRPLVRELVVIEGEVTSSLFEAISALGEEDTLAVALADLFQWDVDFHREVRSGDRFSLLVEKISSEGRVVDYGPVIAATYVNAGRSINAVRYRTDDGRSGYYDERGRPLRKQFLRAPLRFSRITSRFSRSRMHPILGRRMPHWGVDYGAPVGTPVMATADGVVVFMGKKGGGGNTVELRHANAYTTAYLHLSRFRRGLRAGARVSQGDVIGYVGTTGLTTGPHLDYRVTRDGRYINPTTIGRDPAPPLKADEMTLYMAWTERVLPLLATPGPARRRARPLRRLKPR
jgi:murein DD-endopeptidase MepM/ murein hydrolase activator NlpD